jgi:hypothetical protein
MSVHFSDGIGFSAKANGSAMYLTDDVANPSQPPNSTEDTATDWSPWGSNNQLPKTFADDIENAGVLQAASEAKSRIAVGKGIMPFLLKGMEADGKEILEFCFDNEMLDWRDMNNLDSYCFDKTYDRNGYGWNCSKLLFNKGNNFINRIFRHDVYEARLARKDNKFRIPNLYLSAEWDLVGNTFSKEKIAQIPFLNEGYEIQELNARGSKKEFAIANRRIRNGRQYYPLPMWYAARLWVNLARKVPASKKAMFENQMQLKYIIYIKNEYFTRIHKDWNTYTPQKREELYQAKVDEIDTWLTGEDKWFKSIAVPSYRNPATGELEPDIDIKVIDDKFKDGALLPDSTAANSEIIFSMMMNPALMGNGQPGGPYSNNAGGSNVRESYLVQLMLMEAERKEIARELWIVSEINGWNKKYNSATQRLVWRFPSGLLTTLDTGKSTKGEVM